MKSSLFLSIRRSARRWFSPLGGGLVLGAVALACSTDAENEDSALETVTWHEHIAPLVRQKCAGCHTQGGIAPFATDTYEEAKLWAPTMNHDIQTGSMPPWDAADTEECQHPAPFKDDLRLTEEEKALFQAWVDQQMPEGDPTKAAPLPLPPAVDLQNPSTELVIPTAVAVSGNSDRFTCFVLDPGNTQDVWLTGVQVTAGNPTIVHHVLVYSDPDNQSATLVGAEGSYECFGGPGISSPGLIGAWAPGAVPAVLPLDTGMPLRAGTKLIVQVHYHPTGAGVEVDDSTRVALRWVTERPGNLGALFLIGNFASGNLRVAGGDGFGLQPGPGDPTGEPVFMIPAGASHHVETLRYRVAGDASVPLDLRLWAMGTHMHYVGTDMLITSEGPAGKQCLLQTPTWDFNWQRAYYYDRPMASLPSVRPGDVITMRCTYNNSLSNPFVRAALDDQGLEAPRDVFLGEETLDEMCLGVFGVAVPALFGAALGLD